MAFDPDEDHGSGYFMMGRIMRLAMRKLCTSMSHEVALIICNRPGVLLARGNVAARLISDLLPSVALGQDNRSP